METLGIDFGTSYTFIVKYDSALEKNNYTVVASNIYQKESEETIDPLQTKGIKTAIAYENNKAIVGWEKIKKKNCSLICSNLKQDLRNIDTTELNNNCIPLKHAYDFFDAIFDEMNSDSTNHISLQNIERIVIGQPANELPKDSKDQNQKKDLEIYKKILKSILNHIYDKLKILYGSNLKLEKSDTTLLIREEPVLAGIAYVHNQIQNNQPLLNQNLLVVDIGGGTTDFAMINQQQKKVTYMYSGGDATPAGADFDDALAQLVGDTYKQNTEQIKENIFFSKNSFRMQFYCRKLKNIGDQNTVYNLYRQSGMRYELDQLKISYNSHHDTGWSVKLNEIIVNDTFDWSSYLPRDIIHLEPSFTPLFKNIVQKLKNTFQINFKSTPFGTLLFVGGTCRMHPLREFVANTIKDNLGIECTNIFIEELGNSNLTCSNAVAIGAALCPFIEEESGNPMTSVPNLYLKVDDENLKNRSFLLLSQNIKNGTDINYLKYGLPINIKFNTHDVKFQIIKKIADNQEYIYPSISRYFSFSVKDSSEESLCLCFFADSNPDGTISVYVCRGVDYDNALYDNALTKNDKSAYKVKYNFRYNNGNTILSQSYNKDYIFDGRSKPTNIKQYQLIQIDNGDEKCQGKAISAQTFAKNKQYGWELVNKK